MQDENGVTPLMIAVANRAYDVASMLLEHGAKADILNKRKVNALFVAVKSGHYDLAKLLLDSGANCNTQNINGDSHLHGAIFADRRDRIADMIRLLVARGAKSSLDIKSIDGDSALMFATLNGMEDVVTVLLNNSEVAVADLFISLQISQNHPTIAMLLFQACLQAIQQNAIFFGELLLCM